MQPPPPDEDPDKKKKPDEENTTTQLAKTALWMLIIYWFITVLTMLFPSSNRPDQVSTTPFVPVITHRPRTGHKVMRSVQHCVIN